MSIETAVQAAVYERLSGYPGMPVVYDDVPQDSKGNVSVSFPYVVIGDDTHVPWDTDDATGAESVITLHVWSRFRGRSEVKAIQGLIFEALNRFDLEVEGFQLVTLDLESSESFLDEDGQTRHGVSSYRLVSHV